MRLIAIVCLSLLATPVSASSLSAASNEELIDALVQISEQTPGVDSEGEFTGFIGEDQPTTMEVGLVGAPEPSIPPAMRELVRRGVYALPTLLLHLSDARLTKLVVKDDVSIPTFGGMYFTEEYDMRNASTLSQAGRDELTGENLIDGGYTVRVGDICFFLIGQIVNRRLIAVRYQPTALVFINSPVRSPRLAQTVREDWKNLTAVEHTSSLLADLDKAKDAPQGWQALERLRFYYPKTYSSLSGSNARKREAFEAAEKRK